MKTTFFAACGLATALVASGCTFDSSQLRALDGQGGMIVPVGGAGAAGTADAGTAGSGGTASTTNTLAQGWDGGVDRSPSSKDSANNVDGKTSDALSTESGVAPPVSTQTTTTTITLTTTGTDTRTAQTTATTATSTATNTSSKTTSGDTLASTGTSTALERTTTSTVTCVQGGGPAPLGTVCRPAAGVCDVAETCDGVSLTCPPNKFLSQGAICRPAAGACDVAETCRATAPTARRI